MTRNREIDCEDLFDCEHEPSTPISDGGEILYWLCRCGERVDVKTGAQIREEANAKRAHRTTERT